jgi:LuxR family maltose regulon positive regulatory protein
MALVAAAVVELHSGSDEAACTATQRALDFATTSGLGEYHGIAPALAIRAALAPPGEAATADAEHAVALARRATTKLGLVFVLVVAGDVLLREGLDRGRDLLDEARRSIEQCPDAGINVPLLARTAARHRVGATKPMAAAGLVEQLSEREMAVLRYLPSTLSLPEIARELYVSPNTVKTQCSAIYRKLAVDSRQAAVQAARERRLL